MISYTYDNAPPKLRAAIERGREILFDKDYALGFTQAAPCWIAGGALRRFFALERRSSDIDLFFPNEEARLEWWRHLFGAGFESTFENENVERLTKDRVSFDLVKKFYPSPEATLAVFDFTVACAAVTRGSIHPHEDFFVDLAARRLAINACPYPESTLMRLQKYVKNGYTVCPDAVRAIASALKGPRGDGAAVLDRDEPITVMSAGRAASPFAGID